MRSVYGCKPTRDSTWHLDNILVQEEAEYRCLKEGEHSMEYYMELGDPELNINIGNNESL